MMVKTNMLTPFTCFMEYLLEHGANLATASELGATTLL
ncbi:hypothetical protein SLEP1_g11572 [Rubroshorea leprosula]|nr:hypothetical protein SLEP1_g11572 [Rubroshorea leprosula]